MSKRRIRIGIDVGGTFTDAVALDNETYEIVGQVKVPTTHTAPEGVARGIVLAVQKLLADCSIEPSEVVFIAHGTTQATNALLEGDVVQVGILGMGRGVEGLKARTDTDVGDIELAPGKVLRTVHEYLESSSLTPEVTQAAISRLVSRGAKVVVASEAFSVDNPANERLVMCHANELGLPATGSHEISKLYGLRVRTRTAVVNGSILPRMMETVGMTEKTVKSAGIPAPLMIMRCDGGVMTVDEVRKRPILTMLSGPAAGVAGALMYEKVSDGIFLEVGGTSTDISCIRDGKVMIEYAEVGGHKTYLNSLDVRTVGIAGGSMIRLGTGGRLEDLGPRSAHIAGLPYAVYADPDRIVDPVLVLVQPGATDPANYVAVRCGGGQTYALTLSCAANIVGVVGPGDYAFGNPEAARRAFQPLAQVLGLTVEQAARRVLEFAAGKVTKVIEALISDYGLGGRQVTLVGGGGGAGALVPYLAGKLGLEHRIARNAPVISTIGVALAMVREMVERTVPNPGQQDILRIRKEAEEAVMRAGATPRTIEVQVEVDSQYNIVRAIATGATELRTRDLMVKELPLSELKARAGRSFGIDPAGVKLLAQAGRWFVFGAEVTKGGVWRLFSRKQNSVRVLDKEGVVRLQKSQGDVRTTTCSRVISDLRTQIDAGTVFGDAGGQIPEPYLLCGERMIDLSGLQNREQVLSLAEVELAGLPGETTVVILTCKRS